MNDTSLSKVAAGTPAPRALLFFLSHQDTYRRPLLSENEVFCGPDAEPRTKNNRVSALKTPLGSFDVGDVLRQLPADQHPELLVVKADATGRIFPRNLAKIAAPKVLLVGDTHHFHQPIRSLIRYAQEEPFDFVIFDHTRHHARFFAEAGLRNLFWLPALDYGYVPRSSIAKPSRAVTFVGQAGKHHPYRCAVLEQVRAAGIPVEVLQAPLAQTADLYADSLVTLNISLNGDLNLRVFEALSAGGFLLTDELSEDSGLNRLFESGKHLVTWRTADDLAEKIRYYLGHPEEAQQIRREGQDEIQRHHTPAVKLKEFYDLLGSGRVNPRYDFRGESWYTTKTSVSVPNVLWRIAAHESVQALHRTLPVVELLAVPAGDRELFVGLPRVRFADAADVSAAPEHQVLCWSAGLNDAQISSFAGCRHLNVSADAGVADRMAAWGLAPIDSQSPLYRVVRPGMWLEQLWARGDKEGVKSRLEWALGEVRHSDDCLSIVRLAEELGELQTHVRALEVAVGLDRSNTVALIGHAAVLMDQGEPSGVTLMLEEAARVQPLPAEVEPLRAQLAQELANDDTLRHYFRVTGRQAVEQAENPLTILVVTNLLPPQELGGYGRMMWEFAYGLRRRGHRVRVLTANATEFAKSPTTEETEFESCVNRGLKLAGTWRGGKVEVVSDVNEVARRVRDNAARVRTAIAKQRPDLVLAGNIDLLGLSVLRPAFEANVPVLHAVANAAPGYAAAESPTQPLYWVAPCSDWNGEVLREGGFTSARMETLYPGARIDRFFRFFLPDATRLRICYASLVMPYKGAHTLIGALLQLHRAGVDFTAEIAGDAPDAQFLADMQKIVRDHGLDGKVRFTGFLDRDGLAALYSRSNVLVFPSMFQEPFGISQVEAMASGLVVVSSGTGGAKEIVRDGVDGLLFTPGEANDLAEKLSSLSRDPALMAELQRSAQARAVQFSVDAAVQKIEALAAEMGSAAAAETVPDLAEFPAL